MQSRTFFLLLSCFLFLMTENSCTKPSTPLSEKAILSFVFKASDNQGVISSDHTGTINGDSIIVMLPFGTNIKSLVPAISIKGQSVSPANLAPQNFSNAISYTVTGEDGSTKKYTVIVSIEPPFLSSGKSIISSVFKAAENPSILFSDVVGVISNDSIRLIVPFGTVTENLVPAILINGKSITPATQVQQDFSRPSANGRLCKKGVCLG